MPEAFAPDGDEIPDAAAAMAPGHFLRLGEWRTVGDYVAARMSNNAMSRWPRGDGHPVLVIPRFLAGRLSTQLLRDVLRQWGYRAYDWGMGTNLGYRPRMTDHLPARVRQLRARNGGQRVSIIG
jgi:hypothetical protein